MAARVAIDTYTHTVTHTLTHKMNTVTLAHVPKVNNLHVKCFLRNAVTIKSQVKQKYISGFLAITISLTSTTNNCNYMTISFTIMSLF